MHNIINWWNSGSIRGYYYYYYYFYYYCCYYCCYYCYYYDVFVGWLQWTADSVPAAEAATSERSNGAIPRSEAAAVSASLSRLHTSCLRCSDSLLL